MTVGLFSLALSGPPARGATTVAVGAAPLRCPQHSLRDAPRGFPYPAMQRGLRGFGFGSFLPTLGDLPARRAMPSYIAALNKNWRGMSPGGRARRQKSALHLRKTSRVAMPRCLFTGNDDQAGLEHASFENGQRLKRGTRISTPQGDADSGENCIAGRMAVRNMKPFMGSLPSLTRITVMSWNTSISKMLSGLWGCLKRRASKGQRVYTLWIRAEHTSVSFCTKNCGVAGMLIVFILENSDAAAAN